MRVDEPKLVSLLEVLGMSEEKGNRIVDDLWEIYAKCDDPADLAERIVEKYGAEVVYTSMCVYILLDNESREISGRGSDGS